ncbi:hypothetical protein [Devosia sp. 1635]|uniref:hypothetical protein n=1 Tax=Devosia sp. 1635 TaxID=2726066 RepID=UPI0015675854|nr:hypothetical protein [Devosia sp. 1635]
MHASLSGDLSTKQPQALRRYHYGIAVALNPPQASGKVPMLVQHPALSRQLRVSIRHINLVTFFFPSDASALVFSVSEAMPKDKQLPISRFARPNKAVWLDGCLPGVILKVDGEFCLVRSKTMNEEGLESWGEPFWVEAYTGPLLGTPPRGEAETWLSEVAALAPAPHPPRPASKRAKEAQADMFW